jgi:Zn-dependent protease with chaperone function
MDHPLFVGRQSLRMPSEFAAFWLTALLAFPAALAIGYVLHESIGASQVALFIVIAMVYVTLARGRLLGSSVRIAPTQYPRVFSVVRDACAALEIPMPSIFVREDNFVPAVALGFGEPYALVLSGHWVEVFSDDELAFIVGRELGHIAAGHTRFHSLLSVNGNENPLVSLIFGAWLRRCAFTCDKVGLLCCGSIHAAIRAMGIAAFHEFGRRVDYEKFAEQQSDLSADSVLRLGEWLSSEPYATRRIAELRRFMTTPHFETARDWFVRERGEAPPELIAAGETRVRPQDCSGWWRRFAAWGIDAIVVTAIITSFGGNAFGSVHSSNTETPRATSTVKAAASAPTDVATIGPFTVGEKQIAVTVNHQQIPLDAEIFGKIVNAVVNRLGFWFWFPVYLAVLVTIVGQTFGMMIAGLHVVTVDFRKPSVARILARYFLVGWLWWLILPFSLVWRRILLHDRWTKTRLVKVERAGAHVVVACAVDSP